MVAHMHDFAESESEIKKPFDAVVELIAAAPDIPIPW